MRRQPDITFNGLSLPLAAAGEIQQTYEPFGGIATRRFADGTALRQTTWRKLRTTISGAGWIPPGLGQIDWDTPVTIGCVAGRAIQSVANVIALPAARRTDAAPYGFAVFSDGTIRPTAVAVAADTATLTTVAGAVGYAVHYYPLLTVYSDGPQERFDAAGAIAGWEVTAEET